MAARVLQGRFVQDAPSVEVEVLESVAVCVALSLLETVLEKKPPRLSRPVNHFLEGLLRAARWDIENALVAKLEREDVSGLDQPALAAM